MNMTYVNISKIQIWAMISQQIPFKRWIWKLDYSLKEMIYHKDTTHPHFHSSGCNSNHYDMIQMPVFHSLCSLLDQLSILHSHGEGWLMASRIFRHKWGGMQTSYQTPDISWWGYLRSTRVTVSTTNGSGIDVQRYERRRIFLEP